MLQHVGSLMAVRKRENAEIAIFITQEAATKGMIG